ncbi:hypothetical protein B0A58_01890 [Flavobacterium branchiophilum NBRC 15030 = ATCC 35035]|uniref:Lipoprotein n=1 Tax=Flavobacterium branchiophilum TaxID=55197 RepID=A0A543G2T9_9FLAO|nr:hypothetical protein [Flavobacterium branchiophilum]OXA80846.1 hypothetical protein B0A58_01890 [Flavobacterium branchiophilum NBRC 15030 = ATCC 35035]TQM40377.1 hypothetical protein BC670_1260 [Flavobacterium branchiophilum]GEM54458.1 hypothetical protein FB1_06790 [Flavobacterium branchiophilum NBRC 15030 = ATCC 35035]
MKKIIGLVLSALIIVSCGKEKKTDSEQETLEVSGDKFTLEIEGIYEKDDSLIVFYENEGFFVHDKPTSVKVKGSPLNQKIIVDMPKNIFPSNFKITVSTNKDQKNLLISNVTIKNGKLLIDGSNDKYSKLFATDESFSWDEKNSRFTLNHSNKYPPSFIGTKELIGLLATE